MWVHNGECILSREKKTFFVCTIFFVVFPDFVCYKIVIDWSVNSHSSSLSSSSLIFCFSFSYVFFPLSSPLLNSREWYMNCYTCKSQTRNVYGRSFCEWWGNDRNVSSKMNEKLFTCSHVTGMLGDKLFKSSHKELVLVCGVYNVYRFRMGQIAFLKAFFLTHRMYLSEWRKPQKNFHKIPLLLNGSLLESSLTPIQTHTHAQQTVPLSDNVFRFPPRTASDQVICWAAQLAYLSFSLPLSLSLSLSLFAYVYRHNPWTSLKCTHVQTCETTPRSIKSDSKLKDFNGKSKWLYTHTVINGVPHFLDTVPHPWNVRL